jgi:hypothetical protein
MVLIEDKSSFEVYSRVDTRTRLDCNNIHPRPYVSAQEMVAETEHQDSGAQREPRCNVHAVW